ncbi:hypothetical protein AAHA92_17216 [Salvia divinorum]|uniref:Uncharacterized protein n=1 Tax=Salvia divinorum TaxID=28513 RepID=A0ABD1H1J0_SALDI
MSEALAVVGAGAVSAAPDEAVALCGVYSLQPLHRVVSAWYTEAVLVRPRYLGQQQCRFVRGIVEHTPHRYLKRKS